MTDLAVSQAVSSETAPQPFTHLLADLLRRLSAVGPISRSAYPPAWELTGITRIERYEAVPWLSI